MRAAIDGHCGKLLLRQTILVHIPSCDHRVERRDRRPIGLFKIGVTDCRQCRYSLITRLPGGPVFSRANQHGIALTHRDRVGRMLDHDGGRGAACDDGRIEPRSDPEVFRKHRTEHEVWFGKGIGGQHAINIADLQARFFKRPHGCLGVQAQPAHIRNLADFGFAHAHDRHLVAQGLQIGIRSRIGQTHFCSPPDEPFAPDPGARRNCGTFADSPRCSKQTCTGSPICTQSASSPTMFVIIWTPSARSIMART